MHHLQSQWNEARNQSIRKLKNIDEITHHKTVNGSKKRITKEIRKYIEKLKKTNHIIPGFMEQKMQCLALKRNKELKSTTKLIDGIKKRATG